MHIYISNAFLYWIIIVANSRYLCIRIRPNQMLFTTIAHGIDGVAILNHLAKHVADPSILTIFYLFFLSSHVQHHVSLQFPYSFHHFLAPFSFFNSSKLPLPPFIHSKKYTKQEPLKLTLWYVWRCWRVWE